METSGKFNIYGVAGGTYIARARIEKVTKRKRILNNFTIIDTVAQGVGFGTTKTDALTMAVEQLFQDEDAPDR